MTILIHPSRLPLYKKIIKNLVISHLQNNANFIVCGPIITLHPLLHNFHDLADKCRQTD